MYRKLSIGAVIPAYNEELLIGSTIESIPDFVDYIVIVNDGSKDGTLNIIRKYKKSDKRIVLINNTCNRGIGFSLKAAIKMASELGSDRIVVIAGDAQMDTKQIIPLIDNMTLRNLDFIKANRFMHFSALKKMPRHRRVGNIIVTILTKFSTGYYSIFDTQNGYVVYTNDIVKRIPWDLVGDRYEYENTILIGLSIIDAKIGDYPIPAIYNNEKSTIKLFSTTTRVLHVLFKGFWQRIYYKYILYGFHPIALFLFCGLFFLVAGVGIGGWILFSKIITGTVPTSGTVMLAVLPMLVGLQMLLTALVMDVIEEKRS